VRTPLSSSCSSLGSSTTSLSRSGGSNVISSEEEKEGTLRSPEEMRLESDPIFGYDDYRKHPIGTRTKGEANGRYFSEGGENSNGNENDFERPEKVANKGGRFYEEYSPKANIPPHPPRFLDSGYESCPSCNV